MTQIYYEQDADLSHLHKQQVAILGYGNLGRSIACNLRDSGVTPIVGNINDGYADAARADNFSVLTIPEAVQQADIIFMAMPDETMPQTYLENVAPHLGNGNMLLFASGYNIAFEFIEPPIFVDVGLIAPRTLASNVREHYLDGVGFHTFLSLHRKATPQAVERLLAMARAIGGLKTGGMSISFREEVELDLFWQQAILPALHGILLTAAQILVREGYTREAAFMDLYLSGQISAFMELAGSSGLIKAVEDMSLAGQYGLLSRTERFQEAKMQFHMEGILEGIRNGSFAREWASEYADGYPRLSQAREKLEHSTLWTLEEEVLKFLEEKK